MSTVVLALVIAVSTTQVATTAPRTGTPTPSRSVTLITGDRVVVLDENKTKTIIPGTGREKVAFSTYTRNGHLFVVPRDAVPLVTQRRLDERLFDITTLLSSGYDDRSRATIPLIVSREPGMAQARIAGATTTANLAAVNASAMTVDKNGAAWPALAGAGIKKVWLNGKRRTTLDRSTAQISAPAAWQAGYTGDGVKVAVLDTGVDQTHPDLTTREIAEKNFTDSQDAVDRVGHGTHVASTVAGTGARYRGVAYGANILDGKVLNDEGDGFDSWIIEGMQWAVGQGAKVVNLSLGGADTPEIDPLEEAVNTLSATHGTLFVIAAGNDGPNAETVRSPGSADAALTVGAVGRDDNLAKFSSRGPRVGDAAVKPDITAPGVGIVAAKAAHGKEGTPVADGYVALSGTSMATPHVAGAAALLAQVHPDWAGQQLKATLAGSAKPNSTLTAFQQGAGRVDVAKVITQTVTTTPTHVEFGTQLWPHDDDKPTSKKVTYRNAGKADVTFDVALSVLGPDGKAAPEGILTVSPAKVTVPAGGEASVTVTGDTRKGTLDGFYSGTLTAAEGTSAVHTAVVINREVESYTLTINHIGLDGAPAGGARTVLTGLSTRTSGEELAAPDGTVVMRLPKDDYSVDSDLGSDDRLSWLVYPMLSLTADTTIAMDFRRTRQTRITPPDQVSELLGANIVYLRTSGRNSFSNGWLLLEGDLGSIWTAHVGPTAAPHELSTQINTQWTNEKSDYFGLNFHHDGAMVTGFTKTVRAETLARVHATFGATVPGRTGLRYAIPYRRFSEGPGTWTVLLPVELPGARDEYYTTEGNSWSSGLVVLAENNIDAEAALTGPVRTYQPGRTYEESFNRGVFGPAMPKTHDSSLYVTRTENRISAYIPLFGDGSGNAGRSRTDKATTVLYHDGKKIGETTEGGFGTFDVPAQVGNYLLTTEATRSGVSDVTTTVRASWTFRSGAVGTNPVRLPLSTVRFTPALDATNSAPAGKSFIVPVSVQAQNGEQGTMPRSLRVEASFDGGRTWTEVKVKANLFAIVQHPNDATSVSLRAKATDRAGNTVEQTIINAYKLH